MDAALTLHITRRNLDQLEGLTGTPLPADLARLLANLDAFLTLDAGTAAADLAAAVRTGADPETVRAALTLTAALNTPAALAAGRDAALRLIVPELRQMAASAAREAHAAIAQRFNETAAQLTADVKVAPASITAEQAVGAAPAVRKAWLARADQLATLDALHTAMRLCLEMVTGVSPKSDTAASLSVDFDRVTPADNRTVWDLIDGPRLDWLALAALDVLGARPLDTPAAPRHPGLVERWERAKFGSGRRIYDPVADAYVG